MYFQFLLKCFQVYAIIEFKLVVEFWMVNEMKTAQMLLITNLLVAKRLNMTIRKPHNNRGNCAKLIKIINFSNFHDKSAKSNENY